MSESPFVHQANLAFGVLFLVLSSVFALSQSGASGDTSSTASSELLLEFQQNRQALSQEIFMLIAQGETLAEIYDSMEENPLVQTQKSLALQLGANSGNELMPWLTNVTFPEGASQDLQDLMTTQATLGNLRAQIHNQLVQEGDYSFEEEESEFQAQAKATLVEQDQCAQRVAAASDQQALASPPPLVVPANATGTLQAFLTLRDQLMRAEMAIHNQNLQLDSGTRAAAIMAWKKAHAAQFQQLQQLAQNLAQTN